MRVGCGPYSQGREEPGGLPRTRRWTGTIQVRTEHRRARGERLSLNRRGKVPMP
jgi:hypothetical protein